MNRKIIIKPEDLDREIYSLLTKVGADMPIDWDENALTLVRDAVIEAFGKVGVHLEIEERLNIRLPLFNQWIRGKN
jgi:hypothetical protein